jgi:hypothetical protein
VVVVEALGLPGLPVLRVPQAETVWLFRLRAPLLITQVVVAALAKTHQWLLMLLGVRAAAVV